MKKLLTYTILLAILVLACIPTFVRAADIERKADVALVAGTTNVKPGDTVEFKVVMNKLPAELEKVYGIEFYLTFDDNFFENYRQPDDGEDFALDGNTVHVTKGTSLSKDGAVLYTFLLDVKSAPTGKSGIVTLRDSMDAGSLSDGNVAVYFLNESYTATVNIEEQQEPDPTPDPTPSTVAVTGVTVNPTSKTLKVGETVTIQAIVSPSNATNKKVTWASSDTKVASVSSSGVVTAKAEGNATITAKTNDGNHTATSRITVEKASETPAAKVAVTGVTLNKSTASVKVGEKLTLTASIEPSNATNKNVTWESSDKTIATVDAKGVVTGVKVGTAKITVTTEDGAKTDVATIAVTDKDIVINTEDNKQSSGGSTNSGSSSSKTDGTTAKGKIPQTGQTFIALAGLVIVSGLAIVSYKKVKANRDI